MSGIAGQDRPLDVSRRNCGFGGFEIMFIKAYPAAPVNPSKFFFRTTGAEGPVASLPLNSGQAELTGGRSQVG